MKQYIQFKVLGNGYVPNTIPPQYKAELRKPIDKLGSDGVMQVDGRYGINRVVNIATEHLKKHTEIVGFTIHKADAYYNATSNNIVYHYKDHKRIGKMLNYIESIYYTKPKTICTTYEKSEYDSLCKHCNCNKSIH